MTVISVATPMVNPSMLSEARSLWARRALSHSAKLSRTASIGAGSHFQLHSCNPNSVVRKIGRAVLVNLLKPINQKGHEGTKRFIRKISSGYLCVLCGSRRLISLPSYSQQYHSAGGSFMGKMRKLIILAACTCMALTCLAAAPPDRQVAITIDDLPAGNAYNMTAADITQMTTKLLAALRQQNIPVVGFVNEKKLYRTGETDERIKALDMWLDAGMELGNHTFSHTSLNKAGLKAWEDDVVQGESVTRLLLVQHKMTLRYFRHPYLDTGRDLQTRRDAEAFLVGRGYRIAPITLDAWDWMYGSIYEDAKKRGDTALQQEMVRSYLAHSDEVFAYYEQLSKQIVSYEPKQILLLHGNWLEADHIGELADLMRKRGYRFITLEDALSDQSYSLPDTYVGEEGTSWLDHWAITMGKPLQGFPEVPASIMERHAALTKPQAP